MSLTPTLAESFSSGLARQRQRLEQTPLSIRQGRLRKVSGLVLEVEGQGGTFTYELELEHEVDSELVKIAGSCNQIIPWTQPQMIGVS